VRSGAVRGGDEIGMISAATGGIRRTLRRGGFFCHFLSRKIICATLRVTFARTSRRARTRSLRAQDHIDVSPLPRSLCAAARCVRNSGMRRRALLLYHAYAVASRIDICAFDAARCAQRIMRSGIASAARGALSAS